MAIDGGAMKKISKTEEEWRTELSPESYRVTRQAGTERPHTGAYNKEWGGWNLRVHLLRTPII